MLPQPLVVGVGPLTLGAMPSTYLKWAAAIRGSALWRNRLIAPITWEARNPALSVRTVSVTCPAASVAVTVIGKSPRPSIWATCSLRTRPPSKRWE